MPALQRASSQVATGSRRQAGRRQAGRGRPAPRLPGPGTATQQLSHEEQERWSGQRPDFASPIIIVKGELTWPPLLVPQRPQRLAPLPYCRFLMPQPTRGSAALKPAPGAAARRSPERPSSRGSSACTSHSRPLCRPSTTRMTCRAGRWWWCVWGGVLCVCVCALGGGGGMELSCRRHKRGNSARQAGGPRPGPRCNIGNSSAAAGLKVRSSRAQGARGWAQDARGRRLLALPGCTPSRRRSTS